MSLFCLKWLLIGCLNIWQKPPPHSFMIFQREKPKVTNCSFRSVLTIHPLPKQTHAKLIFSWQIYRFLSWRFHDILSMTLESCKWNVGLTSELLEPIFFFFFCSNWILKLSLHKSLLVDMNVNNSWLEEANALIYCKSPHGSNQLETYSSPYAGRGCSSISAPLPPK